MFSFVAQAQVRDWGDCVVDGAPTIRCLEIVLNNLIFVSSTIAIIILLVMFLIGSIRFIVSGGNADKLKVAKSTIEYAFIGLFLFVGAYLIINIIDILFLGGGGKLFHFEIPQN